MPPSSSRCVCLLAVVCSCVCLSVCVLWLHVSVGQLTQTVADLLVVTCGLALAEVVGVEETLCFPHTLCGCPMCVLPSSPPSSSSTHLVAGVHQAMGHQHSHACWRQQPHWRRCVLREEGGDVPKQCRIFVACRQHVKAKSTLQAAASLFCNSLRSEFACACWSTCACRACPSCFFLPPPTHTGTGGGAGGSAAAAGGGPSSMLLERWTLCFSPGSSGSSNSSRAAMDTAAVYKRLVSQLVMGCMRAVAVGR